MTRTVGVYYLSFVDPEREAGDKFVGGCFVLASDPASAVQEAWRQGCNPGGEVAILEVPEGRPIGPLNRLLSRAEVTAL